ncbi:hypothetical protein ACTL6U_08085 [Rhodovibrionaceae bacterium A322]
MCKEISGKALGAGLEQLNGRGREFISVKMKIAAQALALSGGKGKMPGVVILIVGGVLPTQISSGSRRINGGYR